jgi:hypothetical protein
MHVYQEIKRFRVRVEDLELRVPNLGLGFRITRKRGREAQGKRQEARGKRHEARLMRAREESTSREQGRRAREESKGGEGDLSTEGDTKHHG